MLYFIPVWGGQEKLLEKAETISLLGQQVN